MRDVANRVFIPNRVFCAVGLIGACLLGGAPVALRADTTTDTPPLAAVTAPFILLGDTQEHEITGLPIGLYGGATDRYEEVTIRPPQHALFGHFLFSRVIADAPATPIIHLGDLLDVSCKSEFIRFHRIFADLPGAAPTNLALVPGNHDGLAHGIFNPTDNSKAFLYGGRGWDYECRRPHDYRHHSDPMVRGHQFSKDELLSLLADRAQGKVEWAPKDGAVSQTQARRIDWRQEAGQEGQGLVKRMLGQVIPRHLLKKGGFAKSYLVQAIDLPRPEGSRFRVRVIAIDTTQFDGAFGKAVRMLVSAAIMPGLRGSVLEDQINDIKRLVVTQKEDEIIVFAGHHNWEAIDREARWALAGAFKLAKNPIVYLSAHTHEGSWHRWRVGNKPMLEFNVSSLADWPVTHRNMCIFASDDRSHLRVVATLPDGTDPCLSPIEIDPAKIFSIDEEAAPLPAADSLVLIEDVWRKKCTGFNAIVDAQRPIIHRHKELRTKFGHLLGQIFWGGDDDDLDLYREKLVELTLAGQVLLTTAQSYPLVHAALSVTPYASDTFPIEKAQCNSLESIVDCLGQFPAVADPDLDPAQLDDKYWDEAQQEHDASLQYYDLARVIASAQTALDKITDADMRDQLSCVFAAAALLDQADGLSEVTKPEKIPLMRTFYLTSADATSTW